MGSPPRAQGCSFAAALAKARVPAGCDLTQTRLTTFGFKVRIRRARWVGCGICRAEERKVTTWAGWGSSGQTFKCNRDPPGVPALRPCFPSAARRSRTNLSAQIPGGVQCWDSHVHPGRPSPWSLLVLKWRCKCERAGRGAGAPIRRADLGLLHYHLGGVRQAPWTPILLPRAESGPRSGARRGEGRGLGESDAPRRSSPRARGAGRGHRAQDAARSAVPPAGRRSTEPLRAAGPCAAPLRGRRAPPFSLLRLRRCYGI